MRVAWALALAAAVAAPPALAGAAYEGPVFDAHLHCNDEAFEGRPPAHPLPDVARDLMQRYPGLMGELSYRPGLMCEGGLLCPEWRRLLVRCSDRFLIGSDTWVNQRWQYYDELEQGYRRWLGELPADAARRIAWDNGARLVDLR